MPIEIPYTFVAGTKAKASEVNADFNAVQIFVDQLENQSAEIETNVESLGTNKANKNGDSTEVFRMADASGVYDGVNLRTFNTLSANCKGVIFGFVVSKQSNTSVNATPGACYNSTYEKMIKSDTSLTKDQAGLSANATYYVYVTSDEETGNCELVISLSNSSPELPTGYEYYRRLAVITTDSNGYIDSVVNDSGVDLTSRQGFVGITLASQTSPAQQNMFIFVKCEGHEGNYYDVYVNGVRVAYKSTAREWGDGGSALIPVKRGQSFSVGIGGSGSQVAYYSMV